ncbi:MAG TPA: EamA family transporter [Gaiellaceae bacterium]|nr:EamA family transporter [Gaiellaceae bacterium]
MTRAYWPLLGLLAAVWGASYLFIKVAVDELEPTVMMFFRLVVAASLLLAFVAHLGALRDVARAWRAGLVLGVVNAALPFCLIAWGEQYVDSGVAAIANATVPLFNALLVIRFLPSERLSATRLAGVLLGLAGVAVLTGGQPSAGGWWAVAGTLAVVVASLSYAAGGVYGQLRVRATAGPVLAAASMTGGALVLLPFALLQLPHELPSREAIGSVLALAVLGTALAQLVVYRMLRLHGSSRFSLVTYLLPPVALFYGAVLLDEPLRPEALAGLVLILAGVAVGSGKMRRRPQHA